MTLPFLFNEDSKIEFTISDGCDKEIIRYGNDGSHLKFICEVQGEHKTRRFTMSHAINGNIIRVIIEMEEEKTQEDGTVE